MAGEINWGMLDPQAPAKIANSFFEGQRQEEQNQLLKYQLETAKRADAQQNALNAAWSAGVDPVTGQVDHSRVSNELARRGMGAQIPMVMKAKADLEKELAATRASTATAGLHTAQTGKIASDAATEKLTRAVQSIVAMRTPAEAIATLERGIANGTIDEAHGKEIRAALSPDMPQTAYNQWKGSYIGTVLNAHDQATMMQPKPLQQDNGGTNRVILVNPMTGEVTVAPGSEAVKTVSEAQKLQDETSRRGQDIGRENNAASVGASIYGHNLSAKTAATKLAAETDPALQQTLAGSRETGKEEAKNKVAAQQALPQIAADAEMLDKQIDQLIGKAPDAQGKGGTKPHPGMGQAVGARVPGLSMFPGTQASDFQKRFDQIMGSAFMAAYKTLKGGGQITEVEGARGTAAITRMSTAQSEEEFITAAREFQQIVRTGVQRARAQAGGSAAAGQWEVVR